MFPGDVRVPGGSSARWGPAQSEDVRSEGGQSLGAKVGVDEVQVSAHNHHGRVGSSGLQVREDNGPVTMRSREWDIAVLDGEGTDGSTHPSPEVFLGRPHSRNYRPQVVNVEINGFTPLLIPKTAVLVA